MFIGLVVGVRGPLVAIAGGLGADRGAGAEAEVRGITLFMVGFRLFMPGATGPRDVLMPARVLGA